MRGFVVITDRRLIFVPDNSDEVLSVLFSGVENYRSFTKLVTADLFIDIDGRRLRFNGAKTFVDQCCRQLGRFAGVAKFSPNPSASRPDRVRELQERYAYLNPEVAPLLAEATQMNQIETELAKLGAEPDE
jgi:hypothetical protein